MTFRMWLAGAASSACKAAAVGARGSLFRARMMLQFVFLMHFPPLLAAPPNLHHNTKLLPSASQQYNDTTATIATVEASQLEWGCLYHDSVGMLSNDMPAPQSHGGMLSAQLQPPPFFRLRLCTTVSKQRPSILPSMPLPALRSASNWTAVVYCSLTLCV